MHSGAESLMLLDLLFKVRPGHGDGNGAHATSRRGGRDIADNFSAQLTKNGLSYAWDRRARLPFCGTRSIGRHLLGNSFVAGVDRTSEGTDVADQRRMLLS